MVEAQNNGKLRDAQGNPTPLKSTLESVCAGAARARTASSFVQELSSFPALSCPSA